MGYLWGGDQLLLHSVFVGVSISYKLHPLKDIVKRSPKVSEFTNGFLGNTDI